MNLPAGKRVCNASTKFCDDFCSLSLTTWLFLLKTMMQAVYLILGKDVGNTDC
jgi:hypothetical protein